MEIPGFYRDPRSGKYYRINEHDPNYISFLQNNQSPVHKVTISPKPNFVFDLLKSRETGMKKTVEFENSFLRLRLEKLDDLKSNASINISSSNILYLKGGYKSMFGFWKTSYSNQLLFREISYHYTDPVSHLPYGIPHISLDIIDLCEGWTDSNCIMILSNDIRLGSSLIYICYPNDSLLHSECKTTPFTLFCCASNSVKKQFAIGGENLIKVTTFERSVRDIKVKGNVRSILFNQEGVLAYCGIHLGNISIVDLRQRNHNSKKLFNCGIVEMLLLSNNHDLICCSFDGELCKFDIRMMKEVTKYYGHVHTPRKLPFSVDETMNLLCATGSDNVSRLWSLNGGNPIKTIMPPLETVPHRSWLVSDNSSTQLHIIQQDIKYCVGF